MADSPLSIVASVTGILTFFAAIVGFVYVRYKVLDNASQEIMSTRESVVAFLRDTASFQQTMLQPNITKSSSPDLKGRILVEVYIAELQIIRLYRETGFFEELVHIIGSAVIERWHEGFAKASSWPRRNDIADALGYRHGTPEMFRHSTLHDLIKEARDAFALDRYLVGEKHKGFKGRLVGKSPELALAFSGLSLLLNFGATPKVLQWYIIRKRVLEKVQVRENLRSRLLFYEVITTNLVAQQLLAENATLKSDLDELRALTLQLHNRVHDNRYESNSGGDPVNNGIDEVAAAEVLKPLDEPETAAE